MGTHRASGHSSDGTARTGPASTGERVPAGPTSYAGFVLLYSPSFRSMPAAYVFDREALVVGRGSTCEIVLDDHAVSRQHARITHRDGAFHLEDLGSRNGVLVDGVRTTEAWLEPLQEVRIGDAIFKFVETEAEQHLPFRLDGAGASVAGSGAASALVGGLAIRRLERELTRIAPTDLSCVILGETGTGKEVLARELHRLSGRTGAFQAINCGAIPQNLVESELFGYRRGAFSGAQRDKPGLVQLADRGTLFLDEIGDMPLDTQVKLLRVLQAREVLPVGATHPVAVDLRVVCATHRDLYGFVREGKFRGDLFARLNEHTARLPPLRDHKESIYALVQAFLARHASRRLEPSFAFMVALLQYDWPFNVRELESAIRRAAALAEGGVLEPRHLPPAVVEASPGAEASAPGSRRPSTVPEKHVASTARSGVAMRDAEPSNEPQGFLRGAPTEPMLRKLLEAHEGNVAGVGRELGKGRMQVHRWLRRYGISLDDYRRGSA
jgi:DNA-binding NtrC family response regulator